MSATRMRCFSLLWVAALVWLSAGCALVPLSPNALAGEYEEHLGLNFGSSLVLRTDGSFKRELSLTYCVPLVTVNDDGTQNEQFLGWTNRETGKWKLDGDYVVLETEDRQIENPACEKSYFDAHMRMLVVREVSGLQLISAMGGTPARLKRSPIRSRE